MSYNMDNGRFDIGTESVTITFGNVVLVGIWQC